VHEIVVRGLIDGDGVGRAFVGQIVVMDLERAQAILGEVGKVSQIDVAVDAGEDRSTVQKSLEERLPHFLQATQSTERKTALRRTIAGFQLMLNATAAVALGLAVLVTSNRLAAIYRARSREVGVMRALGTAPSGVLRDLVVEAFAISVVGVALGVPLSWVLAQAIAAPVADAMSLNFRQSIAVPAVPLCPAPVVTAALAGLLSGVTAGLRPAWTASRASVLLVLRDVRTNQLCRERRGKIVLRWLTVGLAPTLLALQLRTGNINFGIAGTIVLACAAALLLRPAIRLLSEPVHALLGPAAAIGVRDQGAAPGRAVSTSAVILGGVAVVVWIANTSQSFESFVVDALMATRRGDLTVDSVYNDTSVGVGETRLSHVVIDQVASIPGVRTAGAIVYDHSERSQIGILAVDPVRLLDPAFGTWAIENPMHRDSLRQVASGDAVFGNAQLLSNLGLRVGDLVSIETPTGLLERPLVGVVNASFLSQRGDVVLSRELYRSSFRRTAVNEILAVLEDGARPEDVSREIRSRLAGSYHLRVRSSDEVANWFADNVRQGFAVNDVIMLVTLVVVVFGSADALAANVAERARDIGVLRALGFTPGDVVFMVLTQALVIGLVGAMLGAVLGVAMSFVFVEGVLRMALGWRVAFHPAYAAALSAAALGLAASVVGATMPALRAARFPAVDLLRYE
jgi:putative ABC transport system permease protein